MVSVRQGPKGLADGLVVLGGFMVRVRDRSPGRGRRALGLVVSVRRLD